MRFYPFQSIAVEMKTQICDYSSESTSEECKVLWAVRWAVQDYSCLSLCCIFLVARHALLGWGSSSTCVLNSLWVHLWCLCSHFIRHRTPSSRAAAVRVQLPGLSVSGAAVNYVAFVGYCMDSCQLQTVGPAQQEAKPSGCRSLSMAFNSVYWVSPYNWDSWGKKFAATPRGNAIKLSLVWVLLVLRYRSTDNHQTTLLWILKYLGVLQRLAFPIWDFYLA